MNLEQLRAHRNGLAEKMKALVAAAGTGSMADAQTKEFDTASAEFDGSSAQIARLEKLAANEAMLAKLRPSVAQDQLTEASAPRPGGPEAKKTFETFGHFLHAVVRNPGDQRLEYGERDTRGEQRMDDGPSGGFAVPVQFRGELLSVEQAAGIVRPRALVIPAGSPPDSAVSMPALDQGSAENMFGGVEVTWIAEGATKPTTDAKIKMVSLTPHEVAAKVILTDKLMRNWPAAGVTVSELLRRAMAAAEDYAFLRGDGVAKPKGVIGGSSTISVNRETASEVHYADVVAMEAKLLADAIPVWVASRAVIAQLRKMEDSEGHLIWTEGNAVQGRPNTLLGYPVMPSPRLPALGAKGDLSLADFRYYLVKDGSGPFIAASEHVLFSSNQTVIKAFWNVDGQCWLNEPITDEDGEEYSPFVQLDVVSA
jgi:HK97 family phage major capsid protein